MTEIVEGKKDSFQIVLTPKMLIYMGRFLGKVALEYWAKAYGADIFRQDFDSLRQYVRNGTTKHPWPILHNHLLENLLIYKSKSDYEEEHMLYAYRFFEINSIILFSFDIGTERYSIIVNQQYPSSGVFTDQVLSALCEHTDGCPNILFYNL